MSATTCMFAQVYWEAPQLWPFAAAGTVLLLLGMAWLYPAQLRYVALPWRWLLPALRTLALMALLLAVLKPVAVRLATPEERGAVAIIVDRSRSMSIVDNSRSDAELVQLAGAIGRLPAGARMKAAPGVGTDLEALQRAVLRVRSAQDDLDFATISGRDIGQRRDDLRHAIDDYAQTAHGLASRADATSDADLRRTLTALNDVPSAQAADQWKQRIPRQLNAAAEALAKFRSAFDQHLHDSDPQVRQACDELATLSRLQLIQRALSDPSTGLIPRLAGKAPVVGFALASAIRRLPLQQDGQFIFPPADGPEGFTTDLTGGVAAAAAMIRARAIVLLSDGRQVGGDSRAIAGLAAPGVPIFTVGVAASAPPRDAAFAHVNVPAGGFVGDTLQIRAEIRHEGIDGVTAQVHLNAGDAPELVRPAELHAGQPAIVEFPLELKNEQSGAMKVTLSISGIPNEATDANNRVERWIKVMPERMRIAVWSDGPGWDARELTTMLEHRGEIELSHAILGAGQPMLALSPQDILRQDVIVICDVPVTALSAQQWDAVTRLVSERGGSVIMVVGEHLPSEYSSTLSTSALLPFAPPLEPRFRVWPGERPAFRIVPDVDAMSLDVLKLASDPLVAWRRWQELPPVYRFLQLPGIHEGKLRPGTRALLVEADSNAPVLVERPMGAGRTFLLCTDETWRWRLKVGGRDQDRFWRQLIHYAAREPYFANSKTLALDADRIAIAPETPVRVRARILEGGPGASPSCRLQITRGGKPFETQTLQAVAPAGSGRYEAELSFPEGSYNLSLRTRDDAVNMPLLVQRSDEAEMADLSGDDAFLHRIAEASGGEFFRIENIDHLPDRLAAVSDRNSQYVDLRLWDSPWLYVLVVGCLAAEWAMRKQCGLT
jgi:hypothetical protein